MGINEVHKERVVVPIIIVQIAVEVSLQVVGSYLSEKMVDTDGRNVYPYRINQFS